MKNKILAEIERIKEREPLGDFDIGRIQSLLKVEEWAEELEKELIGIGKGLDVFLISKEKIEKAFHKTGRKE